MLSPNAKAEQANAAKSEDRGTLRPDGLAGKGGEQMRDNSETREHGDINFGLREKPKEAPPERKQSGLRERPRLMGKKSQRREKLRAKETVRKYKSASSEKNAENQHAEDGVYQPGPNSEGHPRQAHALGTKAERGHGEIKRRKQSSEAEERNARSPECEASIWTNKKSGVHAGERSYSRKKGKQIQYRKRHLSSADLQRQEIVAESGLRRRGEHQENHQGAVKHGQRRVAFWRGAKSGEKRNLRAGPDEVNAHQERQEHPQEHTAQGKPEVAQADHFVACVE